MIKALIKTSICPCHSSMLRVSITWHNNTDKKHIVAIIKRSRNYVKHNKTHLLLWPQKNSFEFIIRRIMEIFESPGRGLNSLKTPWNNGSMVFWPLIPDPLVLPFLKRYRTPKLDIVCKICNQNSEAPRKQNAAVENLCFLQLRWSNNYIQNNTDEPAYSITLDHNLKQLQIDLQDYKITRSE